MVTRNQRIRILHPITRLIIGGAQENTLYTASLLDRNQFEVEILSGAQTGSEGSLIDEIRGRSIPLTIIPELVRQVNPWLDYKALSSMTRIMRAGSYRLVHTHSSKAGILGRYAARRAGIPLIVHTIHGWSFNDQMRPFTKWTYQSLERWAASFSDALIFVSKTDKERGVRAKIGDPERYHLIRSGIPFDEFNPSLYEKSSIRNELNISTDEIVIGTVCRFSAQKNPLDWVRIASLVSKEYPNAKFLMVGDGPLRNQVEQLVAEEGLSSQVYLTGIRRDVPSLISAMDIFMMTSLWEGLPRTALQAMRMKLPLLAYRIDGVQEIIQNGQNGFLSQVKDLTQMSRYCLYLIENSDQRKLMGSLSFDLATNEFSLPAMIHKIEDLYTNLLSELN